MACRGPNLGTLFFILSRGHAAFGESTAIGCSIPVLPDGHFNADAFDNELEEVMEDARAADVASELEAALEDDDRPEDPNDEEDEEDLLEMSHNCYLPAGGDVLGEPKQMTLLSALALCEATSSCMGITARATGGRVLKKAKYLVHFKGSFDCHPDRNWVSFRSSRQAVDEIPPPELPWQAPSVETWLAYPGATLLSYEPPMVQFDRFLSDAEIAHISSLAEPRFQKSTGGMTRHLDPSRTSSTAWLNDKAHDLDPVLRGIDARIANLTGVDPQGMEHMQVLRYEAGQFYKSHSDFVPEQRLQLCGSRVATFFMYLNDVPAGGHTHFPHLDLLVAPAKGRALLWWDVNFRALKHGVDVSTLDMDTRLLHEARPVAEGTKLAANKWLHLRNFVDNYHNRKLA